jgi:glutathione S-transferase
MEAKVFPLCPFSRKLLIILSEAGVRYKTTRVDYWKMPKAYTKTNPQLTPPVLINKKLHIVGNYAVTEYCINNLPLKGYLPSDGQKQADLRRIMSWFDEKFYHEITKYALQEMVFNPLDNKGKTQSDTKIIKAIRKNIEIHMGYLNHSLLRSRYLLGDRISLADYTAAAHLSVLDYLNMIPWEKSARIRAWYALIKSRPIFRKVLEEGLTEILPPAHYMNPDF